MLRFLLLTIGIRKFAYEMFFIAPLGPLRVRDPESCLKVSWIVSRTFQTTLPLIGTSIVSER
jgi:hypothetical protein